MPVPLKAGKSLPAISCANVSNSESYSGKVKSPWKGFSLVKIMCADRREPITLEIKKLAALENFLEIIMKKNSTKDYLSFIYPFIKYLKQK